MGNLIKSYKLHEHQLSPFAIYEEESVDGFIRGLTTQPTQSMDASFSAEVPKKMNSLWWTVEYIKVALNYFDVCLFLTKTVLMKKLHYKFDFIKSLKGNFSKLDTSYI